jgi:hypothetical protein
MSSFSNQITWLVCAFHEKYTTNETSIRQHCIINAGQFAAFFIFQSMERSFDMMYNSLNTIFLGAG